VAEQLAIRHGAALAAMNDWVGPHWQPKSSGPQPAALMALLRQAVWREVSVGFW
jgi:hypothetical protein